MEDVVWESILDGRYRCVVLRREPYKGALCIFEGDYLLYGDDVGIAYDAPFGPDAGDVYSWQERCLEVIDSQ